MKFLFFSILFSQLSFALPTAIVTKIKGDVQFNEKSLSKNNLIKSSGIITTQNKSFVKIEIKEWNNTIVLGPNSEMKLDLSSKQVKKKYSLLSGACRWLTKNSNQKKGTIYTKNASFGVRGTDYLLTFNPLLGESEIVMFDGKVLFQNLDNKVDAKIIKKGQWGGLGGRFGANIGKVIDLPKHVLDVFMTKVRF